MSALSAFSHRLYLESDHADTEESLLIRRVSPLISIDELSYETPLEIRRQSLEIGMPGRPDPS
jgi:hypothetical protein